MNRILLTGIPRSGTTWAAEVCRRARATIVVSEPDNFSVDGFAGVAKDGLGFLPALRPGDAAPRYGVLWDLAFAGGWPQGRLATAGRGAAARLPRPARLPTLTALARVAARRGPDAEAVVVKTVYAALALEWIAEHSAARVVVVRRHPLNVLASWLELGVPPYPIPGAAPVAEASLLARVAWTIGTLGRALDDAAARHPEWVVVEHEDLCAAPVERFRELFAALGLGWTDAVEAHIRGSDRPGRGFETNRVASDLPEAWRRRLDDRQVEEARAVLAPFS